MMNITRKEIATAVGLVEGVSVPSNGTLQGALEVRLYPQGLSCPWTKSKSYPEGYNLESALGDFIKAL